MASQQAPVCVVAGAGPGNGLALARRFRQGGYQVVLLARTGAALADPLRAYVQGSTEDAHLPVPVLVRCDLTLADSIAAAFSEITAAFGPVETLLYNAGNGFLDTIDAFNPAQFEQEWRLNQLGLIQSVQQVLPAMRERGAGNIIISGATASTRGTPNFISFAAAKAGQRSIAQSLAKQLMPQGIHVSYLIIDGVIETPMTRAFLPNQAVEFFLQADGIADTVFALTRQPRNAWTFELDLRPFGEKW